ncbi:rhodanese-like domain-containing protein [uncultured Candidatus Thioglobus sp.]|uniref:rhodanese-like domain-containing protein n=1 Tax=uncultured Candidatus Thioglobus sp. TaxID=655186 RepID=UPI0032B25809
MRMLSTLIVLLLLSLSTYGYAEEASKSALEVAAEKTVTDGNTVKKKNKKMKKSVYLKPNTLELNVMIDGEKFTIKRNQDRKHLISKFYQKTGRGIIKPMHPFKPHAVETIAEHEMMKYISRVSTPEWNTIVVDARKSIWLTLTGTLPGATHVPFHKFNKDKDYAREVMEDEFGVTYDANGVRDFSQAKTLAIYCNGNWCRMSPELIWGLLKYGYPAEKIKYYRGGMQAWQLLGLNVVE